MLSVVNNSYMYPLVVRCTVFSAKISSVIIKHICLCSNMLVVKVYACMTIVTHNCAHVFRSTPGYQIVSTYRYIISKQSRINSFFPLLRIVLRRPLRTMRCLFSLPFLAEPRAQLGILLVSLPILENSKGYQLHKAF